MSYIILLLFVMLVGFFIMKFQKGMENEATVQKPEEKPREIASDCCGAHEICEFDESTYKQEIIVYFDDEELDVLRNVRENDLTPNQIDDLREVLYTLRTSEINKWMISLGRRHIHLPAILQQEARQLIAEK